MPVNSFLYFFTLFLSLHFFTLSLSSWFASIVTGFIFINIVAQRFNGLNLLVVALCCIFVISNNN